MGRDGGSQNTPYACKCLNVKLQSTLLVDSQPNVPSAPEYTPVYVEQDEDIEIVYPHLTLRTRKRGPFIPDPTLCARYTSLTCLCCQVLVYRIHQIVSTDDEHNLKEGPIITKGWAETEVLRSSSGWVEVSQDVLTSEAIRRQESSPHFSQLFKIVLPTTPTSPPPTETSTEQSSSILNSIPKYQLPYIPPVFPEVKATRSLFSVLASVATHKSTCTRSSVEDVIDGVVREKIAEIERAEAQLKRDVQLLLNKYNEGIKKAEQEQIALDSQSAQPPASTSNLIQTPASPSSPKFSGVPASVIHDFTPVRPSQPSHSISLSAVTQNAPRVSALSASLATSGFHHPRARSEGQDSPTTGSSTGPSRTPDTLRSASSVTLASPVASSDVRNVFHFRRTANDDINTAASYRYFLLEEEMQKRQAGKRPGEQPAEAGTLSQAGPSTPRKKPDEIKGKKKEDENKKDLMVNGGQATSEASPSPKSKGKRKVTFDIQVNPENIEKNDNIMANLDTGEMMFDLEEIDGETSNTGAVLPLVEQPVVSARHARPRKPSAGGLPQSFPGLRPESLPGPSHLPLRPEIQSASRLSTSETSGQLDSLEDDIPISSTIVPSDDLAHVEDLSANEPIADMERDRDENILNMLAASVPSHRAAWKDDNQLYEKFVRRNRLLNDDEDNFDDFIDDEEAVDDEKDDELTHTGVFGSVPIQIVRRSSKPQPPALSLASYQPETVLSSQSVPAQPARLERRPSSTIRRAAYAERDLDRGIDPGALDFVAEEENENEQDEESSARTSREKAQRILEARSQVPADGMLHSMI
ncbi:hypothetical protein K435DRAFT_958810 [Dendrothele bispora CBS 962.96]|uniref:Uncharacterized protein n=1 Tax=Dendrothele bispora (strain CBS 962.96) TaxID=1314807 RepID=A0A4S8MXS1_DENBC|nr:hypothetical protein K435DRAFT_958810 [Dendrothele bispora CBS 962.96]